MKQFSAAVGQMTAGDDLRANLEVCADLARRAAQAGAKLLVLPECFAFLGRKERDKLAVAESFDTLPHGPILSMLIATASQHRMWLVGGGMPEQAPTARDRDTRTFNTAVVISPDGEVTARYRKIHLFDVDIPGGAQLRESDSTIAGEQVVSVETPLARLGLSICYDVRFPELYRELVVHHGSELVVVPAAFTAHTGKAHWHTLLRARAIENQCFILAAGQTGRHNDKRASFGHSLIIDPWGTTLAECEDGTGIAVAEIDLDLLEQTRQRMPCLLHQTLL